MKGVAVYLSNFVLYAVLFSAPVAVLGVVFYEKTSLDLKRLLVLEIIMLLVAAGTASYKPLWTRKAVVSNDNCPSNLNLEG